MTFSEPFLIIGHRGAAGLAPENTLPSFAAAIARAVHAVELDVHAVERELIVIHDDRVDRTTNGTGKVSRMSLAELRALDAGDGAQIPILDEVAQMLPADTGLNIELKGPETGKPVAAWMAESSALQNRPVMVSSFAHRELDQFRDAASARGVQAEIAPLFHKWSMRWQSVVQRFDTRWVNLNESLINASRMRELSEEGMWVNCYTVNSLARARELAALGVRGVFTDRPDEVNLAGLAGSF